MPLGDKPTGLHVQSKKHASSGKCPTHSYSVWACSSIQARCDPTPTGGIFSPIQNTLESEGVFDAHRHPSWGWPPQKNLSSWSMCTRWCRLGCWHIGWTTPHGLLKPMQEKPPLRCHGGGLVSRSQLTCVSLGLQSKPMTHSKCQTCAVRTCALGHTTQITSATQGCLAGARVINFCHHQVQIRSF
jgi:hypothetical protein